MEIYAFSPLHERQERRVECIRLFEFVGFLTKEQNALVYQLTDNQTQDFTEVSPGNKFLLQGQRDSECAQGWRLLRMLVRLVY
jgi:succinylglutamate desuccinylase